MNIKFCYLYRDGANYKNYNEVVFDNPNNLSKEEVEVPIRNSLIDKTWFVASIWGLPDIHFREYPWNTEIDHDWHEFHSIEETLEPATEKIPVGDFLNLIQGCSKL